MRRTRTFFVTQKSLDARKLAVKLMAEHGLGGWQFAFNNRKTGLGLCVYPQPLRGRPGRIELSVAFIERISQEETLDTILHEIAHALAGKAAGHGPVWKAICRRLGARPERCSVIERTGGKYLGVCVGCEKKFHRFRRPKANCRYHCPTCGPTRGAITWRTSAIDML